MITLSEKKYLSRLKNKHIDKEEYYFNPETDEETIIATYNSKKVNIYDNQKKKTVYYLNKKEIYKEDHSQDNNLYTYLFTTDSDKEYICPSCGYKDKLKKFSHGCPYCKTEVYVEYKQTSKDNSYAKKQVYNNLSIGSFICLILVILGTYIDIFMYIAMTFYPILFVYDLVRLLLIIFNSDKNNDIWYEFKELKMRIDEQKIYNELNNQLKEIYFDDSNKDYQDLIDFHISRFESAKMEKEKNNIYIVLKYSIKKYYLENNQIVTTQNICEVKLDRNKKVKHKEILGTTKCKNCGSPINYNDEECSYCGSKNESILAWQIKEFICDPK